MSNKAVIAATAIALAGCSSSIDEKFAVTCSGHGPKGSVEHTFIVDGGEGVSFGYEDGLLYGPRGGSETVVTKEKVTSGGLLLDRVKGTGEHPMEDHGLSGFTPPSYTYTKCTEGPVPTVRGHFQDT